VAFNLFVTSKNETANSPIHKFTHSKPGFFILKPSKDISKHFRFVNWWIGEFMVSFFRCHKQVIQLAQNSNFVSWKYVSVCLIISNDFCSQSISFETLKYTLFSVLEYFHTYMRGVPGFNAKQSLKSLVFKAIMMSMLQISPTSRLSPGT
jgi:hypothetical protein